MQNKIIPALICLLLVSSATTQAQPVKQWQDRHGEWHFGDPRAAPTRGSSDVRVQRPISVVTNTQPLPAYTATDHTSSRPSSARRPAAATPTPARRSKADCESLRESLRLTPTRPQQQQRQQQYERECVVGVYYADSTS